MRQTAETVIFLHIPKTAGTTLHRIINRHYDKTAIFTMGADAFASVREFKALPASKRAKIEMLRGHMAFGLHHDLPQPARYFTILRDPVERVLSYYYFIRRTPDHYLYDEVVRQQMSLKALLQSELPLMMNDGQTRLLSGVWGDVGFGGCTPDILAQAEANLQQCAVVGLMERFDETLLLLQRAFGWQDIFYQAQNVTRNRPQQRQLDAETLALVAAANQMDMALYKMAWRLFRAQIRQQGISFRLRAPLFKWQNRYRPLCQQWRRFSLRARMRQLLTGGDS